MSRRVVLALCSVLATACAEVGGASCLGSAVEGSWTLEASDARDSRVSGSVVFAGSEPRLTGEVRWAEGAGEPLSFPLDSVRVSGDSLFFRFAPAGIRARARCNAAKDLDVSLEWPTASDSALYFSGSLRRTR